MDRSWREGVLPNTFGRNVDARHRRLLEDVLDRLGDKIEFLERAGERVQINSTQGKENCSDVGRVGGRQVQSFDEDCCEERCHDRETHLQELSQAVGQDHEHQLRDRDKINEQKGCRSELTKVPPEDQNSPKTSSVENS